MIVRDVPRTFPEHPLFTTPQEGQQRLLRLLKAYAAADPEVRCSCSNCNLANAGLQLLLYALFDSACAAPAWSARWQHSCSWLVQVVGTMFIGAPLFQIGQRCVP
jgi:hypothetical protein